MLIYCRIRLKTSSLQTLFITVNKRSESYLPKIQTPVISPERIARLIVVASRFVPTATCLPQALVGKILFAENGYTTQLHIGVYKDNENTFEAHAWLSMDGRVILGYLPDLSRFNELSFSSHRDVI